MPNKYQQYMEKARVYTDIARDMLEAHEYALAKYYSNVALGYEEKARDVLVSEVIQC